MGCADSKPVVNSKAIDLSHFSLERVIGQGGFGQVRAATKIAGPDKGKWFAVKVQSKRMVLSHKSGVLSIYTELRTLSRVTHPNLCNTHYAFQDASNLYIVLDLALGGDLRYRLRHAPRHSLPEAQVVFYAAQVLLALEHLHANNILHRDLKPDNMLLLASGYIKLTDFGVSKELVDIDDCRASSGTLGYMAPEILARGHKHGRASEWFAFGVAMHELLTGLRPYSHEALALCRNHSLQEVRPKLSSLRHLQSKLAAAAAAAPAAAPADTEAAAAATDPSSVESPRAGRDGSGANGGAGGGMGMNGVFSSNGGRMPSVLSATEAIPDPAAVRLTPACKDLLKGLLELEVADRLGTAGGCDALRKHAWLAGVDWASLEKQTLPAPFVPDTSRPNCETTRFDLEDMLLGRAAPPGSRTLSATGLPVQEPLTAEEQAAFEGYAFNVAIGGFRATAAAVQIPEVDEDSYTEGPSHNASQPEPELERV